MSLAGRHLQAEQAWLRWAARNFATTIVDRDKKGAA